NIPEASLNVNEICVPEYKYEGMVAALVDSGLAHNTGQTKSSGHIVCPVLRIGKRLATEGETEIAESNESTLDSMIHELEFRLSEYDEEKIKKAVEHLRKGQSLVQSVMAENFPKSWFCEREREKEKKKEVI
ncbi:MAG: hypothetical protein ACR2PH_09650, partial [Desulfobulbia bacterium]